MSPADFPAAMRRLQALGELNIHHISADEVTERVAGIENRIITARTFDLRSTRDDMRHEVRYALRGGGRRSHDVAEAIVKRAGRAAGSAASTSLKSARACAAPTAVARGRASRAYRRSRCAPSARSPISPTIPYHPPRKRTQ